MSGDMDEGEALASSEEQARCNKAALNELARAFSIKLCACSALTIPGFE
jgi:hypothetical protein